MKRRHVIYMVFIALLATLSLTVASILITYRGDLQQWDAKVSGKRTKPVGLREPSYGYRRLGIAIVVTVGGMTACVLALRIIPKYAPGYLDKPYGHTEEDDEKETSDVSAKDR